MKSLIIEQEQIRQLIIEQEQIRQLIIEQEQIIQLFAPSEKGLKPTYPLIHNFCLMHHQEQTSVKHIVQLKNLIYLFTFSFQSS